MENNICEKIIIDFAYKLVDDNWDKIINNDIILFSTKKDALNDILNNIQTAICFIVDVLYSNVVKDFIVNKTDDRIIINLDNNYILLKRKHQKNVYDYKFITQHKNEDIVGKYIIVKDIYFSDFMKDEDDNIKVYDSLDQVLDICGMYEFEDVLILKVVENYKEKF